MGDDGVERRRPACRRLGVRVPSAPLVDPNQTGVDQIETVDEPRHLVAARGDEGVAAVLVQVVDQGADGFGVEVGRQVCQSDEAAGVELVDEVSDQLGRRVLVGQEVEDGDQDLVRKTERMRRYRGAISDSGRWRDFRLRDDDVIITTPSKCGTTWMQTIVAMLILGRVDVGRHLGLVSPWLDILTRSRDTVFGLLEAQEHRRFIKTHTPLDGLPDSDTVTYLAVVRHPLDAALSIRDHDENMTAERLLAALATAGETFRADLRRPTPPADPGEYLRWWIDEDHPAGGTGVNNLADFAHQVRTYWEARHRPNVHLFHYDDLLADLDGEMRRVADALEVTVDEEKWPELVRAATFDSMRSRAVQLVPEANIDGMWTSVEGFFKSGGRRKWAELLTDADLAHYHQRLTLLAGPDLAAWIHHDT